MTTHFSICEHQLPLAPFNIHNGDGNGNGNGNANVKKAIDLLSKTSKLHMHHAFLYISLLLQFDYNVKMPNFTFYGGRKQVAMIIIFSLSKLECMLSPRNQLQGNLPSYIRHFQRIGTNATKSEKLMLPVIHLKSDIFTVIDAKTLYCFEVELPCT